jgi:alanyl-tRNA synthetase
VSHRVIADHLRSTAFLIADGVLPSNEGRGYVLRRIMRRAMRHAHIMGCTQPLMHRLVPALMHEMGDAYPELGRAGALITETLRLEETRFKEMLARGLKLLEEEEAKLGAGAPLPGETAFKLYDTFGFPMDLTADVLRSRGRGVDEAGFNAAMERQRAEARKSWAGSGAAAEDAIWFSLRDKLGATEFLGYTTEVAEGKIQALLVDGKEVPSAPAGTQVAVIVNQTPFYGESGGQVGDAGVMFTAQGTEIAVADTRKHRDLIVHYGVVTRGTIALGDVVEMRVDGERRAGLRAHHSATHLLHEALRRTLGQHVTQKGSLVAPDRLRFDISHPKPLTAEEIATVEHQVNERIRRNAEVTTRLMTPDAAVQEGAMALFGEKYGDEVRVVAMGGAGDERFSVELCGGTHARRTGDLGLFKIVRDEALAAGVRRIEAVAGAAAESRIAERDALLRDAALALRASPEELPARVNALMDERKKLERELSDLRRKLATGGGAGAGASPESLAREVAGVKFAGRKVDGVPAKELKPMADELKQKLGSGVVALIGVDDGKASVVVGVTEDLTQRLSAVDLVKAAVAALGGKGGGGRPDMAQGGGPNADAADAALKAIEDTLAKQPAAAG